MTEPIAHELGHLASARHPTPYDDVRFALIDAIVTANAAGPMPQDAWEQAFTGAMRSLRMRVISDAETALREAARRSRYPARRLHSLLPDAEMVDALFHRLLAQGIPLERLEAFGDDPVARRARGAALDTAWEGAVQLAQQETARWRAVAARVEAWRRPQAPIWITTILVLSVVLVVAGWLGGQWPAPAWFSPVSEAWWRLWP